MKRTPIIKMFKVYYKKSYLKNKIAKIHHLVETERERRARITQWETECIEAIESVESHLMEMLNDPDITKEAFWETYNVEMDFLNIITHQLPN